MGGSTIMEFTRRELKKENHRIEEKMKDIIVCYSILK